MLASSYSPRLYTCDSLYMSRQILVLPLYQRSTQASRSHSPVKSPAISLFTTPGPAFVTSSVESSSLSSESSGHVLTPKDLLSTPKPIGSQPVLPLPPHRPLAVSKMDGILESVPLFYGRKDGSEYPVKYLGAINFLVEEKYTDNIKASMVKQLVFRACLRDNADKWFQQQNEATRLD